MSLHRMRTAAIQAVHKLDTALKARVQHRERREITAILARSGPPRPCDSEALFQQLQGQYAPLPKYGYDAYSAWRRGVRRALALLDTMPCCEPGQCVLEAGCGDGMTGHALAGYGHDVHLTDQQDWRDPRAGSLPFTTADLCAGLPFAADVFDIIVSYNTFEHVPDPAAALAELVRVCRPGGVLYLEFGPLYAGPWGMHAYETLRMPFPQFLFSPEFLHARLKEVGIFDLGRPRAELQHLNQWRLHQFDTLWSAAPCTVDARPFPAQNHVHLVRQFPHAFQGRQLTYADVTTQGIAVTLRKRQKKEQKSG